MFNCHEFKLKSIERNGILVSLEEDFNIPFDVRRIFYTYDVPSEECRGNHAYYKTRQVLICICGSVEIKCFDGINEFRYKLDNPSKDLYIDPKVWRSTYNHTENCVLLDLSSHEYDEDDYIRSYDEFLEVVKCI